MEHQDGNVQKYEYIQKGGFFCGSETYGSSISIWGSYQDPEIILSSTGNTTNVKASGITTPKLTQTSLESIKKNIELYKENATKIVKNSEIYTYHLKSESDDSKKHIGFVIGEKYKTPEEVIAEKGVDLYTMISILWKSNQELNEKIESLENQLKEIK